MSRGFIVSSGGGRELSVDIVGSLTQPAAREKRIWAETDVPISSWVFSATQPQSPQQGMLWIRTGSSCTEPINVLRRNALWVCPTGCKQYVSGAWVNKNAKTYNGTAWVSWKRSLISDGVMTESWTFSGAESEPSGGSIVFSPVEGVSGSGSVSVTVDVTDYRTLTVEACNGGESGCSMLGVSVDESYVDFRSLTGRTERTFDLSSVTGSVTVRISMVNDYDSLGIVKWAALRVWNITLS